MQTNNKIAVIGGMGKAGRHLVSQLVNRGFSLKLLLRKPEKFLCNNPQIEIIAGDARHSEAIHQLITGCRAVINAVGQPAGEPTVFSAVSRNIRTSMEYLKIRRYIVITGLNVDTPQDLKDGYTATATEWMKTHYPLTTADKQTEWEELRISGLDWTMVRLPMIEMTDLKNEICISLSNCPGEHISATSLACFLADQIDDENYIHQSPFIANRR